MARLSFWLYRAVGFGIGLLPITLGVWGGRLLGLLAYALLGSYRRLAQHNIEIAFPTKAPHLRRRIARQHFMTLGGNLFAMEKISRLPRERILRLIEVEGLDIINQLAVEKRGFVFIVSHLGNWELLAQAAPMLFPCPAGTVYQRIGNPYMDEHIRQTRARIGLALFERKEGLNAASELIRKGGAVGVLVDQHAGDAGIWCPLFGRLASTSPLAALLALRAGGVLLPVAMHTKGAGRWKMVIEPPVKLPSRDLGDATARINLALEAQIRRQPEDWFWVHNRWKLPRPKFLLATYKRGVVVPPQPTPTQLEDAESGELFEFAAKRGSWPVTPRLQPFRILIRSSNWLGDAVMTVPAIRAIKRGRPDAHVTVLSPAKLAHIWEAVPEVDYVIPFDPPAGRGLLRTLRGLVHPWKVARLIGGRGFEAAVILPNSIRTAFEVWLAGIPRRVGFPGHKGRTLFLNQVLRDKKRRQQARINTPPEHQVYSYLKLAEFIGATWSEDDLEIAPAQVPTSGTPRIAVCPGAEYGPAKRWLPERFADVICSVGTGRDCEWLLVGTAKDRPVAAQIEELASLGPKVQNLCGQTSLKELIALLRTCTLLLTNDTGTMHLASLLGVRTVSIFGSTEPLLTGPLGEGHTIFRHKVECSPCFLRECPIDFPCMKGIAAGEVAAAVRAKLEPAQVA